MPFRPTESYYIFIIGTYPTINYSHAAHCHRLPAHRYRESKYNEFSPHCVNVGFTLCKNCVYLHK